MTDENTCSTSVEPRAPRVPLNLESLTVIQNAPIPSKRGRGRGPGPMAAFLHALAPGESIVIPVAKLAGIRSMANTHKIKLVTRKISATEAQIWKA